MSGKKSFPLGEFRPRLNQRLDSEVYTTPGSVGFFTIRAYQQQKPFTQPLLNATMVKTLAEERLRLGILVLVYCLMPDHLHLLLTPRKRRASMLTFVDQFKGKSTNTSWKANWSGKLWQPRSFDHILRAEEDLTAVTLYILENPLRSGLVERPQDYLWSGGLDIWEDWYAGLANAEWANRAQT